MWGSVVSSDGASQSRAQQLCDCLRVSILTVGGDLPRARRLSGGFTFAALSQLHNEHCWLREQWKEGERVNAGGRESVQLCMHLSL